MRRPRARPYLGGAGRSDPEVTLIRAPSLPAPPGRAPRDPPAPRRLSALLLVASCVLLGGCETRLVNEVNLFSGLPPGVIFRVNATPDTISSGEEMNVVLRLENTNDQDVSLIFQTTCTLFFLVETPAGEQVYPLPADQCADDSAPGPTWHMIPHEEIERRFTWTGVRATVDGEQPAAPGDYRVFGAMGPDGEVRTSAREVTVR